MTLDLVPPDTRVNLECIDAADKDEAAWTATVDRMIGYGAELDAAEREAVIAYLANK